jgi:hypothetical protein
LLFPPKNHLSINFENIFALKEKTGTWSTLIKLSLSEDWRKLANSYILKKVHSHGNCQIQKLSCQQRCFCQPSRYMFCRHNKESVFFCNVCWLFDTWTSCYFTSTMTYLFHTKMFLWHVCRIKTGKNIGWCTQ